MTTALLQVAGGLGLFLLGMVVMTGALRTLAGDALTRSLARFTRSPVSGAVTGALSTAVIQSSSATTLAAVGFVGAGLLTFPQALGIIFGANIGTTVTGWLVALLGFKLQIGLLVLPLVPLGMVLHLFAGRRLSRAGLALAGFGVLFMGIASLQAGMSGFEGVVTPESFPPDTFGGRLLLVGIGVALTLVTQSSSAGVATALAALDAGTISLHQGAAMVIGMDVGTTATALLATIGGSVAARRTGWAHVVYNLMTGVMAFALLGPYFFALGHLLPGAAASDPELALVGFHSGFNILGTILVLPFTAAFARLITRLVPERVSPFARRLDRRLLSDPGLAVAATSATLAELEDQVFAELGRVLGGGAPGDLDEHLDLVVLALAETRHYLERVPTSADQADAYARQVSALHAVDHLDRLIDRARRYAPETVRASRSLAAHAAALRAALLPGQREALHGRREALHKVWEALEAGHASYREETLEWAAQGAFDTRAALAHLDAFRWLRRVAYHAWRIEHHLGRAGAAPGPMEPEAVVPSAEHGDEA